MTIVKLGAIIIATGNAANPMLPSGKVCAAQRMIATLQKAGVPISVRDACNRMQISYSTAWNPFTDSFWKVCSDAFFETAINSPIKNSSGKKYWHKGNAP